MDLFVNSIILLMMLVIYIIIKIIFDVFDSAIFSADRNKPIIIFCR